MPLGKILEAPDNYNGDPYMARPREFDIEQATRAAMRLFWDRGYDDASLTDLAAAMGIVRPSLQAAFGSKEELYRQAIDLYGREAMAFVADAVKAETAAEVCRHYLKGYCDILTDPASPPGCFMIRGISSPGRSAMVARQQSAIRLKTYEDVLKRRFERALSDGDLPADMSPGVLAETLTVIANGLAIRAETGATLETLHRIVDFTLKELFD